MSPVPGLYPRPIHLGVVLGNPGRPDGVVMRYTFYFLYLSPSFCRRRRGLFTETTPQWDVYCPSSVPGSRGSPPGLRVAGCSPGMGEQYQAAGIEEALGPPF